MEDENEAPELDARIRPLAHPRDHAGLHARGCLGASRARRREDFETLLELMASSDPASADSLPTRALWNLRDRLGRWFSLGRISAPVDDAEGRLPIPGTTETSLADRLPDDLRDTATDLEFDSLPFEPLYRTDVEFAAEVSNQTMHGVMHLAWVDQGAGRYEGQMAIYVKPRGSFGRGYMALIKPFRYWIVYPALMRQIDRTWSARPPRQPAL
jgi:hypothetical protein